MNIFDVNLIAVVAAAACGFVVGGIWYGPVMGKKWMGAVGLSEEDLKNGNMPVIYGCTFALSLIASWTLAHAFATYAVDLSVSTKILTALGVAVQMNVGLANGLTMILLKNESNFRFGAS